MIRLHFNKSNGIFSARRVDRSTAFASEKHAKIPRFGSFHSFAPSVHALMTHGLLVSASQGERPEVPVVVTKWPRVRLFIATVKEYIND